MSALPQRVESWHTEPETLAMLNQFHIWLEGGEGEEGTERCINTKESSNDLIIKQK